MVFAEAFESDFGFTLRERRYPTLDQIQTYALEIEVNLTTIGKSKIKQHTQDKGKGKEEVSHDQRLEDMTKIIKNISIKLVKLELENKNPPRQGQQAQNQISIQNLENSPCRVGKGKRNIKMQSNLFVYRIWK